METFIKVVKQHRYITGFLLLAVVSYIVIRPLLIPGFFPMHDDTQPSRVFEMTKALQDGMFPVRWSKDLGYGYGYPLFSFYAPFVYYLGGLLGLFGIDALTATKLVIGLGFILSGVGMYFFARQFWGDLGGLLSGVFYLLVPYHAVNIYVRGDVAEFWASAFLPFVFWGIWGIYRYKGWGYVVLTSVSYAGLILSHNLTALMVTPFVGIFFLLLAYKSRSNRKVLLYFFIAFVLGLLLSAFYWLPVLPEMKYTNVSSQIGGKADFALHFVCPGQLWESPWGFGGSVKGCVDGMSYRLGKLHILLTLVVITGLVFVAKRGKRQFLFGMFAAGGVLLTVWLMTEWSKVIWQTIPFMTYFQYPWRFLLLATFFSSFLAGGVIWLAGLFLKKERYRLLLTALLFLIFLLLSVFFYAKLFQPQTILPKTAGSYGDERALQWRISKISDEYLPVNFKKPDSELSTVGERLLAFDGVSVIRPIVDKTHVYEATISVQEPSVFRLLIAYFPGWEVKLDGEDFRYAVTSNGYVFPLRSGEHTISAHFVQTPIEKVANLISLAGAAALFLAIIIGRKVPSLVKRRLG